MRVFINEREVEVGAFRGASIGEVVEAARMHVDPREIVTVITLDGVDYNAGADERYARRPAIGVTCMVIHTHTPAAFAAAKRQTLVSTLEEVAGRTRMVVELLRRSDVRAANGLLASLMEELRLSMLLDYQLALLASDAPSAARTEIADLAPALLDAEERRAWETLASLLDTRLAPILDQWARATRNRVQAGGVAA